MLQTLFSTDWLKQFSDPYAVLGLSVTADDRRILKRYHAVAKTLHPDAYITTDTNTRELANSLLAHLVNPAYQQLKQDSSRAEVLAMLRFRVRRLNQEDSLGLQSDGARRLLTTPVAAADIVYEQAIAELAEPQYQSLEQFEQITHQLGELNLVYLRLKLNETPIREKRTGLVSAAEAKPVQYTPVPAEAARYTTDYAQRHYERAQEYMKKANWPMAVQELRDAIRIESNRSDYHSLLAKAYLMQNLPGMAKVHFRQALKFNPNDALALEYAKRLGVTQEEPVNKQPTERKGGLFGLFGKKQ
ncbi:DnaJ domain-containing protein [Oculatella sp. LEGE 06141]|uniref:J domain-containing protein n=1 Tax=Oculatella sp. LEGE 06141 TaxID=1828648 RepID=UPI0018826C60|nr:J domain-containing protein [Oculatella sp. LEGE 06141]MBE9177977.1 DnaJ domain-containing protein [Oculatella sp. LEGE 06141]